MKDRFLLSLIVVLVEIAWSLGWDAVDAALVEITGRYGERAGVAHTDG